MISIKNNSLVVFAGAGASLNCGFPDWTALVRDILKRIEKRQEGEIYLNFAPLLEGSLISPLELLNILRQNGQTKIILEELTEKLRLLLGFTSSLF